MYCFEDVVLGCVIADPKLLDQLLSECTVKDFTKDNNRNLFKVLNDLRKRNLPIDLPTLIGETDNGKAFGGVEYLVDLNNSFVSTREFPSALTQLKQSSIKSSIDNLKLDNYLKDTKDFGLAVLNYENDMFDIVSRVKTTLSNPYESYVASLSESTDKSIHIPLKSVDQFLGGLNPGELCVIGARPAAGKTALVCNLAYRQALTSDKAVAMYSLEMSAQEIFARFVSLRSGVSNAKARTFALDPDEMKQVNESAEYVRDMMAKNLKLNDSSATSITSIRSSLRRIARHQDIGLVIIDYLQLLSGSGKSMYERVTELSRQCKLIAREFDCTVIALSQLSRSVDSRGDKRPVLSDLRESGAIEQDADQVLLLYCDSYYNPPSNYDPAKDLIEIAVAKNRHGSVGTATVLFNKTNGRFNDIKKKEGNKNVKLN